jgi:hypothetical protein
MEWVSDNTLEIHANAMANCALGVNEAGALVNGTNITIFYEVAAAEPGQPLLACVCGNEVICTIEDLEKQEYNISIKELR